MSFMKWIPVEEALPQTPNDALDTKVYLTTSVGGYVSTLMWYDGWNCYKDADGNIHKENEFLDVEAWMDLPAPYRKETEYDI